MSTAAADVSVASMMRNFLAAGDISGAVTKAAELASEAATSGNQEAAFEANLWLSQCAKLAMLASRGERSLHTAGLAHDVIDMEMFLYQSMDMHLAFLEDKERNEAYQLALQRTVQPSDRVFEVGTGTGILAMLAAQAGAAHVDACERVPWVARAAAQVVKDNALHERVRVLPAASSAVAVEAAAASVHPAVPPAAHIAAPATLLLSEIIGNQLVDEGMCGILNDAAQRLMAVAGGSAGMPEPPSAGAAAPSEAAPAAAVSSPEADALRIPTAGTYPGIPAAGRLMGAVVSAESLEIPPPGDELVARRAFDAPPKKRPFGLDFSAFNALIPSCGLGDDVMAAAESMGANDPEEEFMWCKEELAPDVYDDPDWRHKFLSRPFELFSLDFTTGNTPLQGATQVDVPIVANGTAHALIVWLELQMDPAGTVWLTTCPQSLRSVRGLWSAGDTGGKKKRNKNKKKKSGDAAAGAGGAAAPPAPPLKVFSAKNWAVHLSVLRPQPRVTCAGKAPDSLRISAQYADGVGVALNVDWSASRLAAKPKPGAIAAAEAAAPPSAVKGAMPPPAPKQ